ncbi:MAG TPA: sulfatase-like hydrolase/transferase [Anaerolineae bacterium]|nr:sulfatase-like hydrolase/transferase [Anaerolineae bacterium]
MTQPSFQRHTVRGAKRSARSHTRLWLACLVWLLGVSFPVAASLPAVPAAPDTAPNIVLILTDDQDGQPDMMNAMPNLQALLADQGMSFDHFFAPVPLCCPARAILLLGQYAHNSQMLHNLMPIGGFQRFLELGLEDTTVATALQSAGYRTALIGKYLNDYPNVDDPTHIPRGWDEWFVPITSSAYGSFNYDVNDNGVIVSYGSAPDDHVSDVITAQALDFITRTTALSPATPFFVQLSYYAPHSPAVPAPRHLQMFPGAQTPQPPSFNESDMSDKPAFMQGSPLLGPSDIASMNTFRRKQLQSMQAVDEGIAQVVQLLQDVGRLDNTYIIFTSDNGLHAGQHRFPIGKGAPFEEDVRVPLMVRGPGVPAGVVRSELASMIDIVPTLADLGGASMAIDVDGRSLAPLLHTTAPPAVWRQTVLLEHWPQPAAFVTDTHPNAEPPDPGDWLLHSWLEPAAAAQESLPTPDWLALRTGDTKYVRRVGSAKELYDIVNDRYELYSQHADATPAFIDQLNTRLNALYNCAGVTCRSIEELPAPVYSLLYQRADMNRDNRVDLTDVLLAAGCWRQPVVGSCGDRFDMNYDAQIDVVDIMRVASAWNGFESVESHR